MVYWVNILRQVCPQALQKKLKKGGGAASAAEKRLAKAEERQAEKDGKAVNALATKVHRLLTPLLEGMEKLDKKISKNHDVVDGMDVKIFRDAMVLLQEWHEQSKIVMGKIAKGVRSSFGDIGFPDEKAVSEQVKSTRGCMKTINAALSKKAAAKKAGS